MINFEKFIQVSFKEVFNEGKRSIPTEESLETILTCKPFVFVNTQSMSPIEPHDQSIPLDLPFKTCFFEMDEGFVSNLGPMGLLKGIYVHEKAPRTYDLLLLILTPQDQYEVHFFNKPTINDHVLGMISSFLKKIYTQNIGEFSPRTIIKTGNKKYKYRLKKVIFVKPKNSNYTTFGHKQINWTHKWQVRGHWRSIPNRFGKDREGNLQKDFTWVSEHTKGPEDAVLIKKTRVIV